MSATAPLSFHTEYASLLPPACNATQRNAGMLEGQATAGVLGGPEKVTQMRAAYDTVRPLPEYGALPGLDEVEVATFRESLGFFNESTVWLQDYRAVVFADMAFAAYDHVSGPLLGDQGAKVQLWGAGMV